MPSKISDIYDYLSNKISNTWSGAKQIANALDIANAPTGLLENGYAIVIGPSLGSTSDQTCQERFIRQIFIIRTRLAPGHETDVATQSLAIKDMLEDHFLLRRDLRTDNTLGSTAIDIGYDSDGGIEDLVTTNQAGKFYAITSAFTLTYIENLL